MTFASTSFAAELARVQRIATKAELWRVQRRHKQSLHQLADPISFRCAVGQVFNLPVSLLAG
jgi:hypothetical protein